MCCGDEELVHRNAVYLVEGDAERVKAKQSVVTVELSQCESTRTGLESGLVCSCFNRPLCLTGGAL